MLRVYRPSPEKPSPLPVRDLLDLLAVATNISEAIVPLRSADGTVILCRLSLSRQRPAEGTVQHVA